MLAEIIIKNSWVDDTSAEEMAEKWLNTFLTRIQTEISKAREDGRLVPFTLNSMSELHIQGTCFSEPKDSPREKEEKKRRSRLARYYEFFAKITPSEFEQLSGKILTLFKAKEEFVTRGSGDQGIDFYGQVPFGSILKPSVIEPGAESQLNVWLVGQAKHYSSSQVSTSDIRELVGSIELARAKTYAGRADPLANLSIRICDPVFYLFFTTGEISRDGRNLLRKAGVVSMDGMQLAAFLADHKVAIRKGQFSETALRRWFRPRPR